MIWTWTWLLPSQPDDFHHHGDGVPRTLRSSRADTEGVHSAGQPQKAGFPVVVIDARGPGKADGQTVERENAVPTILARSVEVPEHVSMDRAAEGKALAEVQARLQARFPDLHPDVVAAAVRLAHSELDGPVRDFVPVLVEHAARDRLAFAEPGPLAPDAQDRDGTYFGIEEPETR